MTENRPPRTRVLRGLLQWLFAGLVLWFVFRRLGSDWSTVRPMLKRLDVLWIALSIIPGLAYFFLRAYGWALLLRLYGAILAVRRTNAVFMKAEMLRYVPGTVWALAGRVFQAQSLGIAKTVTATTLVLEVPLAVVTAALLAFAFAIIGSSSVPVPTWALWAGAAAALAAAAVLPTRRVLAFVSRLVARMLRREEGVLAVRTHAFRPAAALAVGWVGFTAFQVGVCHALGFIGSFREGAAFAAAFLFAWAAGYIVVFAPSGLGVREAVIALLLSPMTGEAGALLVAAATRVALVAAEILALACALLFRGGTVKPE